MSKQEEIIEVAGKKVRVAYCKPEEDACDKCCFCDGLGCAGVGEEDKWPCEKFDLATAYFVSAEETHSLREWAQILATNPELRAEFDKLCPPQPIQGSIAPEADLAADLEGEIKKMLNSDYYKRHIKPSPYVIDVINYTARHFAEWERARIESELRLAWGKISMNPFDVDSVFRELLEHLKK